MTRRKKAFKYGSNWLNASIVGIQFPVAMALGYFWGKWMDGLFGTEPWLTIIFSILGVVAGFVNLFRITLATAREEERLEKEFRNSDDGPDDA
jgi:F0F1-type ATP synthase assembly protein I